MQANFFSSRKTQNESLSHQSAARPLCGEGCAAMATPPAAPVAVMTDHALQMHSEDIEEQLRTGALCAHTQPPLCAYTQPLRGRTRA